MRVWARFVVPEEGTSFETEVDRLEADNWTLFSCYARPHIDYAGGPCDLVIVAYRDEPTEAPAGPQHARRLDLGEIAHAAVEQVRARRNRRLPLRPVREKA